MGKRVFFIEMMGEPGSYDASVYDHFEDKDQEGRWFIKRFGHLPEIDISLCNVCIGEALPGAGEVDALVLAGSYNSVHDHTDWQKAVRRWLPGIRAQKIPILAICGSHQLLAHQLGSPVVKVDQGPYAGSFPVEITEAGRRSPLMSGIEDGALFHFANYEHVLAAPPGATLLASSGPIPQAALDFGDRCYSTQFHPEGTHITLGTVWRKEAPDLVTRYQMSDAGYKLVVNFLTLIAAD